MAMNLKRREQVVIVDSWNRGMSGYSVGRVVDEKSSRHAAMNMINKMGSKRYFAKVTKKLEYGDQVLIYPSDETFGPAAMNQPAGIQGLENQETENGWVCWSNRSYR